MQMMCTVMITALNWIIYYVWCTIFFEVRLQSQKIKFFYMLYVGISIIAVMLFKHNWFTIFFEILMPIIFFKGSIIKKELIYLGSVSFTAIFTVAINVIICKIMKISGVKIDTYAETAGMLFLLTLLIRYYFLVLVKMKVVYKFSKACVSVVCHLSVAMILLVTIICFLYQTYAYDFSTEIIEEIKNITIGIFILAIIMDMMSFEILKKYIFQTKNYMGEKAKNEFYEKQRKYDKLTAEQLQKLSSLRHDLKNHLYVILERVQTGEKEKTIEYIEKICGCIEEAESIVMTENEILTTILTVKNVVCKRKKIIFQPEIACGEIYIEDIDLNIVVANLLDNAIEAAEKCREDNRKIVFKIKDVKQFLTIECTNTCQEHLKMGESKLQTTKEDKENHGFGIRNIKEIVSKYGGKFEIICKNGIFSMKIMMENM